ncbi:MULTISPECIES: fumarylacetoacetate hydrolase family protein [unclassified Sphingomonas]|uniref:fumarylacetoacetate hydrolase family protein n=1 Tax=unclassified Sphingomonas TaxID=196159 RepID=UPI002151DA8C|nr:MULTISPECIES: fumarylacetoacetate hydrolase family protein [unclassified Sphingomonas]MCR5870756.1 fumarylacetoacetate hydrolase family protein [Sphingomonas sp. J344]UUY00909.1 fumarylacetoacetate hydrolase family protein [Sphingomonas sp. J315]
MRLATLRRGGRDGTLVAVSRDGARVAPVAGYATLQAALDDWDAAQGALATAAETAESGEAVQPDDFAAPLPRAWQWLDGSAFANHGALMQLAFGHAPIETDLPLMYQGMSHQFIAPTADVPLPSEADGIDFEGEFGVITGDVPIGCSAADALAHVRLVVLINDWSLRAIAIPEMKTGFGWVQAKPACSVAPFAVTPDALGDAWRDGRVHLPLTVEVDGKWFGNPNGAAMGYGFHELIAHAARTRSLPAGTIIGSGTVSNAEHETVGSTCMSERRAIEMIAHGAPQTPFLSFGSRVSMRAGEGASPFGAIDQRVVKG